MNSPSYGITALLKIRATPSDGLRPIIGFSLYLHTGISDLSFLSAGLSCHGILGPLEVPEGYEAIKKRIMYIAKNLGVENKGKIVVEQMDSKMQSVRNRLKNIDGYKTVIGYSINGAFGRKNGSFDNICKEANAVNGAGLLNLQRGEHLSKEQIIKLDPDVIICSVSVRDSNMVEEILGDPAFTQIKAIQNKNVVVTEDRYMSSSTQYFVDAVDHISKLVYPEHNT